MAKLILAIQLTPSCLAHNLSIQHTDNKHCFHCGLPIDGKPQFFTLIEKEKKPFCCRACLSVCETIKQYGLDNYYQYRSDPAQRPNPEAIQYLQYDNPAMQDSFTTLLNGTVHRSAVIIEGIHCAACIWLLENTLRSIDGVINATVNFSAHTAAIEWDSSRIQLSDIFQAIDTIGYLPHPYSADQRQRLSHQENKLALRRLGVAGIGMMQVGMFAIALYAGEFQGIDDNYKQLLRAFSLLVASAVLLYSGKVFFIGAWRSIKNHNLNMDVPVSIALTAAYAGSVWGTWHPHNEVYFDSIAMFIFFLLLARYLEMNSRNRIAPELNQNLLPVTCKRLLDNQPHRSFELLPLAEIKPGDCILVQAGETIAADGIVIEGNSSVDESTFTGEFLPVCKQPGDSIMARTINSDGSLIIKVEAIGQQSSLSVVQSLLNRAQAEKPLITRLADRSSQYFIAAVLLSTLLTGIYWAFNNTAMIFPVMLAMLVVSCPCALSLATPAAVTLSTHLLRNKGLLVSRGHVLEQACRIDQVIFDKTGTLTQGKLSITDTERYSEVSLSKCLLIAGALENISRHPIARAFYQADNHLLAEASCITIGSGIEGTVDGITYRIGSFEYCKGFCSQTGAPETLNKKSAMAVWLCSQQQWLACFSLSDEIRESAAATIQLLKEKGYKVSILSGDSSGAVDTVARDLSIVDFHKAMSPEKKLTFIRELRATGKHVMMVGDGINDVPVLAAATISVAMNNASDLTRMQGDALLLSENLQLLDLLISQSVKTRRIITENISWALAYNLIGLPLAACGLIPPYLAAIGMSASSLLVILNTLRLSIQPAGVTD